MLMRADGTPREPHVYFAQYTLLKRKPETIPVRKKGTRRPNSPLLSSMTNIRLSATAAAAVEVKPYQYDPDDFEEEAADQRSILFHLAAESHASGMRSSKREVLEEEKTVNGQTMKGVFPAKHGSKRAPRCADMGRHAASGRWSAHAPPAPPYRCTPRARCRIYQRWA